MHSFHRWRDILQTAPDAATIHALAREYIVLVGPLMAALPADCRAALSTSELNVQEAAVTLLQAEAGFKGSDEARELLHEVAHTFAAASVRLAVLHTHSLPPRG